MGENGERTAGASQTEDEEGDAPGGMLLMIGLLDVSLLGVALYAFSVGERTAAAGVFVIALVLTGVDLWLYRRGSF